DIPTGNKHAQEDARHKDVPPAKLILRLSGKPLESGDSIITLYYKYKGWIYGEPISSVDIPIAFNPDPRLLWKNIPTSKDIPFYKPDFECEYVKVEEKNGSEPRKDIVAASQRGRSHAQEGKARDDHFKIHHCDESDWYIIAVADGAGSAKLSRRGSEIACNIVVDHCLDQLKNCEDFETKIRAYNDAKDDDNARREMSKIIYNIVGNGAFKAHKAIKVAADANDSVSAKDFATTLMFAICKKFEFGWFVASYWVGDGAMCLYNREKGTHKLLGVPDEGEFSGQTRFLTMPEVFKDAKSVMDRLRFSIEDDFTALMLMTDGVSDPMFETDNNLHSIEKWDEFWDKLHDGFKNDEIPGVDLSDDNEESKYQLLRWLDFWSPGNHDDRTIVILY
ncbi:MAG: protein phosphatase 2C domain-containing protein, partial [Bacteroidales bacterium]|nr:protein phosphatase 2C domain-containing protein [Candidatus Colimorpha onthohippi]